MLVYFDPYQLSLYCRDSNSILSAITVVNWLSGSIEGSEGSEVLYAVLVKSDSLRAQQRDGDALKEHCSHIRKVQQTRRGHIEVGEGPI